MLPVYIGWISAQLLGMGTILHVITGISVFKGTMIGAIVVLIYTVSGGMWAVTLTDVVQVSLLALGLIVIMPFAVNEAGGIEKIISSLSAQDLSIGPARSLTSTT
jgi:Na+/proline symporter